jgi:hypothetical protein
VTSATTQHDPELESLPKPRRPWRRLTLAVMAVTAVSCSGLVVGLVGPAAYATRGGKPADLGNLTDVQLAPRLANQWVQGRGQLDETGLEYRRPLDSDRFRLAPLVGRPQLWVEVRVPADLDIEHFVPPSSFVGRLVPVAGAGLAYSGIPDAVQRTVGESLPSGAWLLLDGEAPNGSRWALGVIGLLGFFVAFSVGGAVHLLRPVRDT